MRRGHKAERSKFLEVSSRLLHSFHGRPNGPLRNPRHVVQRVETAVQFVEVHAVHGRDSLRRNRLWLQRLVYAPLEDVFVLLKVVVVLLAQGRSLIHPVTDQLHRGFRKEAFFSVADSLGFIAAASSLTSFAATASLVNFAAIRASRAACSFLG